MRGVFSFLYAFAAITAILLLYSYYASLRNSLDEVDYNLLLLENRHARELELKRAITDTIRHAALEAITVNPAASADEIRDYIGESLAGLKQLSSYRYYDIQTLETRFWCGTPSSEDLVDSVRNASWYKSEFICNGCHSIDEVYAIKDTDNQIKLKRLCALYLTINMQDSSVSISDQDLRASPPLLSLNKPQFGVMVFDSSTNISSVVLVPFSTNIGWNE